MHTLAHTDPHIASHVPGGEAPPFRILVLWDVVRTLTSSTRDPPGTFLPRHRDTDMHTHAQTPGLRTSAPARPSLPFLIPCHVFSRGCPAETMPQGDQPGKPQGAGARDDHTCSYGGGGRAICTAQGAGDWIARGCACVLMTNSSMCERARKTGKSEGEAEIQSQGERREAAAKMQSIYVYCVDEALVPGLTGKQKGFLFRQT